MRGAADGLLAGVRVLDLTNVLAGPFAGYQLALLGADVVKVEVPGTGDLARRLGADQQRSAAGMGASFLAQNGGKRSVTVNLKTAGGREVFRRLLGTADVLLENFRPGVLARLGFGADVLRAEFPGLVYCAVSGFGATGPDADRPAYDQVVQGLAGVMHVTGTPDGGPTRVGFPVCDSVGGLAAALAIAAALVRRRRTGQGAHLDVSMLDAALTTMGWVASDHLVAGQAPQRMGNDNRTAAPSGTFRTQDGLLNIAANRQQQFESLCHAVGRPELLDDPRFRTREDRKAHRAELTAALEDVLRGKPARAWDTVLREAGVPAGPVASVPEALSSPQVRHRGLVATVASAVGEVDLLGLPAHVDGEPVRPASAPPVLGEHTDEVLAGLGYDPAAVAALREEGAV